MRTSAKSRIPAFSQPVVSILQEYGIGYAACRYTPLFQYTRSRIILLAMDGMQIQEISRIVRLSRNRVSNWIQRALKTVNLLNEISLKAPDMLRYFVDMMLADRPRSGAPRVYDAVTRASIVRVACNNPADYGLTRSHWSLPALKVALVEAKIVDDRMSCATLNRILNGNDLKPHKNQYWLHSSEEDEDPITFKIKVQEISGLHLTARLIAQMGGNSDLRILSTDEMTGIQALERIHPNWLPRPGLTAKQEFEYIRHGTTSWIGFFDEITGQVLDPFLNATRSEEDFVNALKLALDSDPDQSKHVAIIADNLTTHISESVVRLVNERIGFNGDLGIKGKSGVLKNKQTRIEFLTDHSHRIRFCFTPKHCSWLNQIEVIFSIINKQLLRRSSFVSVDELKMQIRHWVEQYNTLWAHPFDWRYHIQAIPA